MGIASSCILSKNSSSKMVKLIFLGGATQLLPNHHLAGELMFTYPDRIICHADSFYIGRPLPILSIEDPLLPGQTYFVLPVDLFPSSKNLTTAMLASLSSGKQKTWIAGNNGSFSFEYVKGCDGRMMIRVLPEFVIRVITDCSMDVSTDEDGGSMSPICSTPELRKHYDQLVGCRERPWSPKLETIEERKPRASPVRLLGLEIKKVICMIEILPLIN